MDMTHHVSDSSQCDKNQNKPIWIQLDRVSVLAFSYPCCDSNFPCAFAFELFISTGAGQHLLNRGVLEWDTAGSRPCQQVNGPAIWRMFIPSKAAHSKLASQMLSRGEVCCKVWWFMRLHCARDMWVVFEQSCCTKTWIRFGPPFCSAVLFIFEMIIRGAGDSPLSKQKRETGLFGGSLQRQAWILCES